MRRYIFWFAFSLFAILSGALAGYLYVQLRDLPQVRQLEEYQPSLGSSLYDRHGRLFAEFYQEKRRLIPYSQIPPHFIKALIATEDTNFYRHWGLDLRGILRALWRDIRAGRIVEGGSTITQQLAKVLFLTPEKSLTRKLKEAILALQIEKHYTKQEILELYCNQIYWGSGVYGLEAAARTYFGKPASQLTLAEAALLAGMPRSPNLYSPLKHPKRAIARRNYVLKRLIKTRLIAPEEARKAMQEPLRLAPRPPKQRLGAYYAETLRQYAEEKYGYNMLYHRGLEIYTNLDLDLQQAAEKAIATGLAALSTRHKYPEDLHLQAALLALDPQSGEVLAMVGGRDFTESQFNRATQARRQPGSAFKPLVYAAALEAGYSPADLLEDEPLTYTDPATGRVWEPENFDRCFRGPVTLLTSLVHSLNVPTIRLVLELGPQRVIELARKLGIRSPLRPYPALALGAFEVSLLELTSAYGVFAASGWRWEPQFLRYITDKSGKLLEENVPPQPRQVLSAEAAYILTRMLQQVVRQGTGWRARVLGWPVAAKTGTTDDYTDAWFVGYTGDLAVGVWVGLDRKVSLGAGETGSRAAGPIWVEFMRRALENGWGEVVAPPEGVVEVTIDPETGLLAGEDCPHQVQMAFRQGQVPEKVCRHDYNL